MPRGSSRSLSLHPSFSRGQPQGPPLLLRSMRSYGLLNNNYYNNYTISRHALFSLLLLLLPFSSSFDSTPAFKIISYISVFTFLKKNNQFFKASGFSSPFHWRVNIPRPNKKKRRKDKNIKHSLHQTKRVIQTTRASCYLVEVSLN